MSSYSFLSIAAVDVFTVSKQMSQKWLLLVPKMVLSGVKKEEMGGKEHMRLEQSLYAS